MHKRVSGRVRISKKEEEWIDSLGLFWGNSGEKDQTRERDEKAE